MGCREIRGYSSTIEESELLMLVEATVAKSYSSTIEESERSPKSTAKVNIEGIHRP